MDNDIMWIDLEKGIPYATIAKYGISLNSTATEYLKSYDEGKVGFDKKNNYLLIAAFNNNSKENGYGEKYRFKIKKKITKNGYFRLNNKDLARLIAQYTGFELEHSCRFPIEWDKENQALIIDLNKKLTSQTEKK